MNYGELKERVILQNKSIAKSAGGDRTITWNDVVTTWAKISPLSGREYFQAMQTQSKVQTRIIIRWRNNITPDWRVKYGARIFEIESVIDENNKHNYLELMCVEVVK